MANKLIVGLGNPGKKYEKTRHNVGYVFVDSMPNRDGIFKLNKKLYCYLAVIKDSKIFLAKPTTYMNSSGKAVKALMNYFKMAASDLYVVHDDLDMKLGEYKIQFGKGPKVHKGIESINRTLGTSDYWRVRVGIDNRIKNNEARIKGEDYVLQNFNNEERVILDNVIHKVATVLIERLT